ARLLPPEQVGNQTEKSRRGKLVGVPAHGVVDAPNFHDGDNRSGRRAVRHGQIGAHLAAPQFDPDVLCLHRAASDVEAGASASLSKRRALPAKILSRSGALTSSASTARMVPRVRSRPPCGSNGASVANRHLSVPKNAWPQRVAASTPPSA